jgi:hypothetical protein
LLSLNGADFIDRPPNGQRWQLLENVMRKDGEKAFRRIASFSLLPALLGVLFVDGIAQRPESALIVDLVPIARAKSAHPINTPANTPANTPTETRPEKPAENSAPASRLRKIGERKAVVFSPDFAAAGNRQFYECLGFQYWEVADWRIVLTEITQFNQAHPEDSIEEIFMEAHGSNGNGLKLQNSQVRSAPRSYISLGALQERLEQAGVKRAILTACNTGRLFRPEIYKKLNLRVKDPTVLPATKGVINASEDFDPASCSVELVRRTDSRIEQTSEGRYQELPASVRRALSLPSSAEPFTVSNMFMQMIVKDGTLQLTSTGFVRKLSASTESETINESIFQNFLRFLDDVARDRISASYDTPQSTQASPPSKERSEQ